MTSTPLSQQRLLIDLQSLDSRLARLRHERKHLPVLSRIKATVERLKANRRAAALADGALAEARKGAARSEDEVDQVTRRAAILRERLSSGTANPRDLTAIQGELDQLGRRRTVLEDAQLAAVEALESAQKKARGLAAEEGEIRSAGRELTAERDAAFARIESGREADGLADGK